MSTAAPTGDDVDASCPPPRFCNNDSWKRQRHRLRPVPALLRHPRKSVYGILRPIPAVIPRSNARNNTDEIALRYKPLIGIGGYRCRPSHTTGHTGPYHGGSSGFSLSRGVESGEAERVEMVVA